jgi:hypothetical protein
MIDWIIIILGIGVLTFNTIHKFLPSRLQNISWVRRIAILFALLILAQQINGLINKYNSKIFAHVTREGKIAESKNFRWEIIKDINDGEIIYMISDMHADVSQVTVVTSSPSQKYSLYKAVGGVVIKYFIPEADIRDFEIHIKNSL